MRAQFAVEHLMVVGLGILVLIPAIYAFYGYSTSQSDELIDKQLQIVGNKIVDTSETIYYMGKPSKITIEENFPDKINWISIRGQREFIFFVGDKNGSVPFLSNVPIDGPFYEGLDQDCNSTSFKGACYSPGLKKITMLAADNNVSIIIK